MQANVLIGLTLAATALYFAKFSRQNAVLAEAKVRFSARFRLLTRPNPAPADHNVDKNGAKRPYFVYRRLQKAPARTSK